MFCFLILPFTRAIRVSSGAPQLPRAEHFTTKVVGYCGWGCNQNGHDVDLVDSPAAGYSVQAVIDRIAAKNIEAVVCDTSTPSILNDVGVIESFIAVNPSLHVLLVGRHVSSLPKETLAMSDPSRRSPSASTNTLCATGLKRKHVVPTSPRSTDWCGAGREQVRPSATAPREAIQNLDELPFVSEVYKRFLHTPDYFYGHSLWPLVVFDTSRGCPYHCSFCVYPQTFSGHKMRYRSVNNVADEFDFVAREMPEIKTVMLEDDTFIISKPRTLEFANELIRRGNKLPFDANCRADIGAETDCFPLCIKPEPGCSASGSKAAMWKSSMV